MKSLFSLRRIALPFLMVTFLASFACEGGCGGCGDKGEVIPPTASARVEQMASKMPKNTETAVFLADLEKMRDTTTTIKNRLPNTGVVETVQKQLQTEFGIDILDEESWKRAGVAADSSMSASLYRSRVILMTYVENRQAFEKILTEKAKSAFDIEGVVKTQTQGKHQMKVLSEDPARQIAWTYQGKLALVSFPATSTKGALEEGSATLVLAQVADTTKEKSIGSTKGFDAFKSALGDYPISIFINSERYLDEEQVKETLGDDPNALAAAKWMGQNVSFFGAGLGAEKDTVGLRAYMGVDKAFVEKAKEVKKAAPKVDWKGFATENLMLGLRVSVETEKALALAKETSPEENWRAFRRSLKQMSDQAGFDVEQELLHKLTGNVGIFFYGIAGNPLMLMNNLQNLARIGEKAGLLVIAEFESAESIDTLLQKIQETSGGLVQPRALAVEADDAANFKVFPVPGVPSPGNFYIHGKNLIFATAAFSDQAVYKYVKGERDEKSLAEKENFNLGKDFATQSGHTGLYFNSARAQENLGALLAMGGIGEILSSLQEAALTLDVDDHGVFAALTLDLVPKQSAGGKTDKPAQEK